MELHYENLNYLCRTCAKWIGKRQYSLTNNLKTIIEQVFLVKFEEIENIHPKNICHKCYCTINNANKRRATTSLSLYTNWEPHSINCATCQMAENVRHGTVFTRSLLKKSKLLKNIYISCKYKKCWTTAMFNSIKENILPIHNLNIGIDISELQNELNPFSELCLCCKCNKIPQMPVTLKSCEHLFCFLCLVEEMKNKYIDETFCPKCTKKIYNDDMVTSKKTNSLLQMLTLVCNLCKQKFNALKEYEIFKTHKSLCHNELLLSTSLLTSSSNSKKSINDIFEINKDSDIPQELEEAALHIIIKQKMAKSGQKTIEFKSGGPRVSLYKDMSL